MFNLNKLKSLANHGVIVEGIQTPYTLFSSPYTSFGWHTENLNLYSLSYRRSSKDLVLVSDSFFLWWGGGGFGFPISNDIHKINYVFLFQCISGKRYVPWRHAPPLLQKRIRSMTPFHTSLWWDHRRLNKSIAFPFLALCKKKANSS